MQWMNAHWPLNFERNDVVDALGIWDQRHLQRDRRDVASLPFHITFMTIYI